MNKTFYVGALIFIELCSIATTIKNYNIQLEDIQSTELYKKTRDDDQSVTEEEKELVMTTIYHYTRNRKDTIISILTSIIASSLLTYIIFNM